MMDVTSAFWHFSQQPLRKLFLVTLIPFFLVAFEAQAETPFYGAVSGSFATSPSGAATYTIPIDVPPGIAGLQPQLALTYNSQGGNGLLGMGWGLGGQSVINRCPATIVQDGFKGGINFDTNDRFCLDGQRLIPTGTDNIALYGSGTSYRTEIETFSKIIGYSTQGTGYAYFVVLTKSGQTIEYGYTSDSRIEANGSNNPSVRVWAINKVEDTVGNELNFNYIEDFSNGEYRIDSISYANGQRHVAFTYEDRADVSSRYVGAGLVKATKRLTHIQTFVGTSNIRDYTLNYELNLSPSTSKSRIDNIEECGFDDINSSRECKPAIVLDWGNAFEDGFTRTFSALGLSDAAGWWKAKHFSTISYADLNGDGKADLCARGSAGVHCWIGTGDGFVSAFSGPGLSDADGWGEAKYYSTIRYSDLNGDGKADLCARGGAGVQCNKQVFGANDLLQSLTNGNGHVTSINYLPITDNTIYTKDQSPPQFPDVVNIQSPMYVVASHETDNGIGGSYKMSYTYGGAKSHRLGRGYLGFQWQETVDEETGITTRTEHLQDPGNYEYIGRVDNSEVRLSDNTLLRRVDYSYDTMLSDAGMRYPYLAQSIESQYETDGSLISTVTNSTSGYDLYGNPRYSTTSTTSTTDGLETFTRQTDSTVTNDVINWRLGVITSSKVTNTIPGQPPQSRESSFAYDSLNGLLMSETIEPNNPSLWVTTAYEYDLNGNKTKSTVTGADLAQPRITTTSYDLVNNQFPYVITNAEGHSETRLYDAATGKIISLTGPNLLTTTWVYDAFGRASNELRADGTSTATVYGSGSDLSCSSTSLNAAHFIKTTKTGAPSTVIYFDKLSREVQRCTTGFDGSLVYKDTEYNAHGKVTRVSRNYFSGSSKVWTTYAYDELGRPLTETTDGILGSASYIYAGKTTSVTNPLLQTSSRTVNAIGKLVLVTDALGNNVHYQYDPFGNLIQVTDALGNEVKMGFNIRGHKIWMDDPDMGYWDYGYNVLGEMNWQRDAKLQTTTMQYDKLGRMIGRVDGDGTTTWAYDTALNGIGKLHAVTRPEDAYSKTYGYDGYGRGLDVTTAILAVDYTMSTAYTADGKVDTITYPVGTGATPFAVQNVYNANGYLEKVQKSDASIAYWTANVVNAAGQVTWETLGNSIDTLRSFNGSSGLVSAISTGNMGGVQSLSYDFDAGGNLKQRIDDNQGYSENFLYDDLNRLTSAELVEFAVTKNYQYNAVGNIINKSDVSANDYVYPASGVNSVRPHAVTSAGGNTYSYDANGNMVSGAGRTLSYTSTNKPYDIQAGGTYSTFAYAPNQGRIVQTNNEGTTIYLKPVGNSNTLYEKQTKNNVVTHKYYVYGGSGMVATYQERDNATSDTRYFHKDHLGSIDAITDEVGTVIERLSYDAFGKRRVTPCNGVDPTCLLTSSITTLGFTGHEHLAALGLIHMNGRVYDPTLGRFMSADPQVKYAKSTQGFNRYSYVDNNPLSRIDMDGFGWLSKAWRKIKKAVVIIVVIVAAVYTGGLQWLLLWGVL